MKVSVAVAVHYSYEVEIPDYTTRKDLPWVCDTKDPVYVDIARILCKAKLNYDAETTSIIREDIDEVIYNI